MPRLPKVPLPSAHTSELLGPPLGPPPAPSAYREKNPYEPPPADYKAPSMLAEHRGLALLFLAAVIAFALYCWRTPHRTVALEAPAAAHGGAPAAPAAPADLQPSHSPIYVETVPDKDR